ncbi:MAG: nitroreductase [Lachnospiraceae bacterium]|nr:nitroreductase [Lachnospiraceae bacterium]
MDIKEAVKERHSVRKYLSKPIEEEKRNRLLEIIDECNKESGLNIQLICDDPDCFNTLIARYGRFRNVNNYIAMVGNKNISRLDEKCGYYGERLVLEAQMMGLNTCWVGGTYGKGKCKADKDSGEKIVLVIAIGYGEETGVKHRSKPVDKICDIPESEMPLWFKNGLKAAMMAPTAINQQSFRITLAGEEAIITAKGKGPFVNVDLGIVKYNFEAVSGHRVSPPISFS